MNLCHLLNFSRLPIQQGLALCGTFFAFISPYTLGWNGPWWKFIPATVIIVWISYIADHRNYLNNLGLNFSIKQFVWALFIGIVTYMMALLSFDFIMSSHELVSGPEFAHYGWSFTPIFQVLNEEMVLRALTLFMLAKVIADEFKVNLYASTCFASMHWLLYRFAIEGSGISIIAILTLLFFAISCNAIFQITRSIAIPFAIHLGWNINKFGNNWISKVGGSAISEADSFNLVEGHPAVAVSAFVFTVLILVVQYRIKTTNEQKKKI